MKDSDTFSIWAAMFASFVLGGILAILLITIHHDDDFRCWTEQRDSKPIVKVCGPEKMRPKSQRGLEVYGSDDTPNVTFRVPAK